jgi:hypothetical protein
MKLTSFRPIVAIVALAGCLAVPSIADAAKPPKGAASYRWLRAECVSTASGFRTIARVRTFVNSVADPKGKADSVYYQEVKVQIDRLAGFGASSNSWRKVDQKVYDWSRFTASQTPTHSTSAIRTGLQPDTATLSAKVTVWLKRKRPGPDATVWKYTGRSASFSCFGGPAPALPSPNGGS